MNVTPPRPRLRSVLLVSLAPFLVVASASAQAAPPTAGSGGGSVGAGGTTRELPPWPAPARVDEQVGRERSLRSVGEPGDLYSTRLARGEFLLEVEDLRIRGVGFDFVWTRTHRTRAPFPMNTPMGHGWDHSYNLRVVQDGPAVVLWSGNARRDRFTADANGDYTAREHFCVGEEQMDGSLHFVWPDGSRWEFLPFDSSPQEGRIDAIVDRCGNRMEFAYNGSGLLTTVTDTLDRDVTIAYGANGRITSVTDSIGRAVQYQYFSSAAPGGAAGDLKAVTSPPVLGTPNGNDYPSGKTTTYTYTTGTGDAVRDHNLRTIRSARGEVWLVNDYSAETDPNALEYDRLISQQWGGPGRTSHVSYVEVTRGTGELERVTGTKAIVNDRRGCVGEYVYDRFNRLTLARRFTGFAVAGQPTTETVNRPTGKLRTSDPVAFTTNFRWNRDSLIQRVQRHLGDVDEFTYEGDGQPNVDRRAAGNLLELRRTPGPIGATQSELVTQYEYANPRNLTTKVVDPAGKTTALTYDAEGNLVHLQLPTPDQAWDWDFDGDGLPVAVVHPDDGTGYRRREEYEYHQTGPQTGYLAQWRLMVGGMAARTVDYEVNDVGIVTKRTDELGNDTQFVVNELNQVVRVLSPVMSANGGVRYARDYFYDENDQLERIDVASLDETGSPDPNAVVSTTIDFSYLNSVTRVTREVDASTDLVTEFEYDAEENLTLVRHNEAVNGTVPKKVIKWLYDERDLEYRQVRAPASLVTSTTQRNYDRNGRLRKVFQGMEDVPRVTEVGRDGYGRVTSVIDAMGNEARLRYDAGSHVDRREFWFERVDVPGSTGNYPFATENIVRDDAYRPTLVTRSYDTLWSFMPVGTGVSQWGFVWDGMGALSAMVGPMGAITTFEYDDSHWLATVTDAKGNVESRSYDARGGLVGRTEVHKSDLGNPDETYSWTHSLDEIGRLISTIDPSGATSSHAYDSRGNVRVSYDERGNATRRSFDGVNRVVEKREEQRVGGVGAGALLGERVTSFGYALGRELTDVTDDNGNVTSYLLDELGRLVGVDYADGTSDEFLWNAHDDLIETTDRAGTTIQNVHDSVGRLTGQSVTAFGTGVSTATTFRNFQWDGRGFLYQVEDDDSLIVRQLDSLGGIVVETQAVEVDHLGNMMSGDVSVQRDNAGAVTHIDYPYTRTVDYSRDSIGRAKDMTTNLQAGTFSTVDYVGPEHRMERKTQQNVGLVSDYEYDTFARPARTVAVSGMGTVLDRTADWDAASQLIGFDDLLPNGTQFLLELDSVGHVVQSTETPMGSPSTIVNYLCDHLGNRISVVGGPDQGGYTMDATIPPGDAQNNQYTSTPFDSRTYDDNGGLAGRTDGLGTDAFEFDAFGALAAYVDPSGVRTEYASDALGRRLRRVADTTGSRVETLYYYYGGNTIMELEWSGFAYVQTASYLLADPSDGFYVGAPATPSPIIAVNRGPNTYRYEYDPHGNVAALIDATGAAVETYEYGAFGDTRIKDGNGTPLVSSAVSNPFRLSGLFHDDESGMVAVGSQVYDPWSGKLVGPRSLAQAAIVARVHRSNGLLSEEWYTGEWFSAPGILGDDLNNIVGDELNNILGDDLNNIVGDELNNILGDDLNNILGDDLNNILGDDLNNIVGDELNNIWPGGANGLFGHDPDWDDGRDQLVGGSPTALGWQPDPTWGPVHRPSLGGVGRLGVEFDPRLSLHAIYGPDHPWRLPSLVGGAGRYSYHTGPTPIWWLQAVGGGSESAIGWPHDWSIPW